jgi:hypothetical protein
MITKAKIASMDQWCDFYLNEARQRPEVAKLVGLEVGIEPRSMHESRFADCKGRLWNLSQESIAELEKRLGVGNGGKCFCEHILELD